MQANMLSESNLILSTLHVVVTVLSTASSLLMSFFCLKNSVSGSAPGKLVLCVAISDLLFSFANIMSLFKSQEIKFFCEIEAFVRAWSYMLCLLFPICIAALCYLSSSVVRFDQRYFVKMAIPLVILFGSAFAVVPMFLENIKYDDKDFICRIAYPQIFLWIAIVTALVLTLGLYIMAIRKARRISLALGENLNLGLHRLFWYPAVIFTAFLIPQALKLIYPNSIIIRRIMVLLNDSIGIQNAIIYGVQRRLFNSSDKEKAREYPRVEYETDFESSYSKLASVSSRGSVKISLIGASQF